MSPTEPRFARHLDRLRPTLARLRQEGCPTVVLALLAVESFYRPRWRRAGEDAVWLALSLAAPRRLERLSVGPAQVQLRHWLALGHLDGLRLTPARLAAVRDWGANARACRDFLAARGALDERDAGRLTRLYTGWDRPRFAERLAAAVDRLSAGAGRAPAGGGVG